MAAAEPGLLAGQQIILLALLVLAELDLRMQFLVHQLITPVAVAVEHIIQPTVLEPVDLAVAGLPVPVAEKTLEQMAHQIQVAVVAVRLLTPPSEMISAFGDPGVTEVELLVRLNVVVTPLKPPDISSSLLYEPMSGGLPI